MNTKDFIRLGVPLGEATRRATGFVTSFILAGGDKTRLEEELKAIITNPSLRGIPGVISVVTEAPIPLAAVDQTRVNHPGSHPTPPSVPCRPGSNGLRCSLAASGSPRLCLSCASQAR